MRHFRRRLLRWYDAAKRPLPWRARRDPYRVWVSEVMLQQTRVAVVEGRYKSFLRRFPSVRSLARAPESAVLAEWSGLGYYRRARNLHRAARQLVKEKRDVPRCSADLQLLPGIGRYTAAAIASIAFNQPVAVVDGNVQRVLHRMFFSSHPAATNSFRYWSLANELLDRLRPGDFNQALMELGATVCLPGKPNCARCPVRQFCQSKGGEVRALAPARVRKQKAERYGIWHKRAGIYLVRRPTTDSLMAGMWELPKIETSAGRTTLRFRHAITTTDFKVEAALQSNKIPASVLGGRWVALSRLQQLPLTGLTRKILKRALPQVSL